MADSESATVQSELAFGLDGALHDVMSTMRAMRRLKPDPVPPELLIKLVEAATWAPTASNAQAYSWVIVTERATMKRLAPLWSSAFRFYLDTIAQIPSDTMDTERAARLYDAARYQAEHFVSIPALIIPCYDLSSQNRALRRSWPGTLKASAALGSRNAARLARNASRSARMGEAGSVYPGVQNLLLTARALGLGANLTTTHLFLEGQFKRELGIPRRVHTFAVIPVGWPLGEFGPVRRRPASEAIRWGQWSDQGTPQ